MKNKIYPLLAILCLGSAQAQNIPHLGSASDALWGKSVELNLGKATYHRLLQQGNIYQSAVDSDYLNYLGHRIGVYAPTRLGLTFYLTNAKTINAFATPGGYIGINAGVVLATDNEHQLAGVLAHEIAHVAQEHIARSVLAAKDRRLTNMAAMAAGILLATVGDNSDAAAGAITATIAGETQQQIDDIRRHEIEADREGRRLMQKAGFDELGMQQFFGKLFIPSSAENTPSYLLTHPLPIDRQSAIDSLQKQSTPLHSSNEYYLFRARLRAALLRQDELNRIIKKDRQSQQAQVRETTHYLTALQARNQGHFKQAANALNNMTAAMKNNRDVRLLQAQLYLLNGQPDKAERSYQQLWKQYRGDSVVGYDYAQFLLAKGDYRMAAQLLEKQVNDGAQNPQIYWLYGQILGKLGEVNQQHRILIRYYRQQGDYDQALAQAQLAAAQPDLDWQTQAMFEAEIARLQALIAAAKK